jgi:RHS repeat-associated protein
MKNLARILFSCLLLLWAQLGVSETTETTYYIPDASGSPVAAMDEAGNIKWRKHYKPFGEEIEQDEASKDNRIGYTGHVHDRSTGLTYMGARYYDPEIGRFLSMDPAAVRAGDPRTFNRFAYAANSPYKFIDPDGKDFLFTSVFRRDGDTSTAAFRAVSMGGTSIALAPYAGAVSVPALVTAPEVAVPLAKAASRNLENIVQIAGVAAALSGSPSPNKDIPAGSPLDPKTSVEQVTDDVNRPKSPNKIGKVISSLVSTLAGLILSKDAAVNPPQKEDSK